MRFTALHTWPQFVKAPRARFSATFAGSTSRSTIAGSLPPSSRVTRFRSGAAACATFLPVATEPVKEILRTAGCAVIQPPSSFPPETMLITPAGTTSRRISPSRSVESGVYGEGFSTIVFPASSAGAIFHTASITGKFQGVIAPTTPNGRRRTSTRAEASSCSTSTGICSVAVYLNQKEAPKSSSVAFLSGLPCSRVRMGASSPICAWTAAAQSSSTWRRFASSRVQAWNARDAASIAASSCARLHSGAFAKALPVAGLITSNSLAPATALPSIVIVYSLTRWPPRLGDRGRGPPTERSGLRLDTARPEGRQARRSPGGRAASRVVRSLLRGTRGDGGPLVPVRAAPARLVEQRVDQGRPAREEHPLDPVAIEHLPPALAQVGDLEVGLEQLRAVVVVEPVDEGLVARMQAVREDASPRVAVQHAPAEALRVRGHVLDGADRLELGIEVDGPGAAGAQPDDRGHEQEHDGEPASRAAVVREQAVRGREQRRGCARRRGATGPGVPQLRLEPGRPDRRGEDREEHRVAGRDERLGEEEEGKQPLDHGGPAPTQDQEREAEQRVGQEGARPGRVEVGRGELG